MITRRRVVLALGVGAFTPPLSLAQHPAAKMQRIGVLSPFSSASDAFRDIFQQRLQELGYSAGRNIALEYRASEGMADRLPQLAVELVKLNVGVIVTTTAAGVVL